MNINEYISSLTLGAIVLGWFVNNHLQRKHEITKKRIDYRVDMLKKYLLFCKQAKENETLDGFNDIQISFLLYGLDDEISLINEIAKIVEKSPDDDDKWFNKLIELNRLTINRLRIELGLPKINKIGDRLL